MKRWLIAKLGGFPTLQDALNAHKDKAEEIIEVLGGYPDIDSALDAMRAMDWPERHTVLNMAVKKLFRTITDKDLLKQVGEVWMWKGKVLSDGEIKLLKAEAANLLKSTIWKILSGELEYQAQKKIYAQSEDIPDLVAGKLLIYYKDIVETRLKKMLE